MSTESQLPANSQNSVHHGLTTAKDFIPTHEREEFIAFTTNYLACLRPIGIAEESCALEVALPLSPASEAEQQKLEATLEAIERARSHAHNITRKAMLELRRLQTERLAAKPQPETQPTAPAQPVSASFCKTPQPIDYVRPAPQQIPRGSLCPCQSRRKFKRCCGQNAPPTLHHGAKRVA